MVVLRSSLSIKSSHSSTSVKSVASMGIGIQARLRSGFSLNSEIISIMIFSPILKTDLNRSFQKKPGVSRIRLESVSLSLAAATEAYCEPWHQPARWTRLKDLFRNSMWFTTSSMRDWTEPRSPRFSFKPQPRRSGATTVMSGDIEHNCFARGACQPEWLMPPCKISITSSPSVLPQLR